MGAKSTYTEAIAAEICDDIAEGVPLREICRRDGMPSFRTVYNWLDEHPDFASRFARAREVGFDAIASECLTIADDATNDYMDRRDPDGGVTAKLDAEHIQRSKLRVETRLKLLAKWSPKKYGEKIGIGGAEDLPPLKAMDDAQLEARIKALQEKLSGRAG